MKYSVVLSSLFLCAGLALGQANNDYRPAAGAYGAATNWTLGHVPDSNDVARIGVTNNQAIAHASGVLTAGALVMGGSTRTGTLTVSGGELSYAAPSIVGTNGSIAGIVNNGGLLIFSNGLTLASSTGTATYGALTNNSGTVRVEGNLQVAIHGAGGGGARGMLTVNGGTVTVTGNLATANATAYSYIRLNGGVLEVAGVTHAGSATERVLFFNGGTLRALRDNTAFLPVSANGVQMTNAVQNGGAFIDTQGFSILIGTPILADGASTGRLTKLGTGTLTLTNSGASNFRGGTMVAAGTLAVGNNAGETAAALGIGRVTVSNGATLHFKPGSTATSYSFTNAFYVDGGTIIGEDGVQRLAGNSTFTVGSLGASVQASWSGKDVYIDGAIVGSAGLNLAHGPTAGSAATIHLVSGASSYSGTVSVSGAGTGVTLSLDTSTGLQYAVVNLNPGTPGSMTITPAGGATIAGLTGSGGTVRPATAAGTYTLSIRTPDAYSFGGTLVNNTGILALNKAGTGTQTLTGASTYSGDTTVSEGALALGVGGSLASPRVTTGTSGVFDVTAVSPYTVAAGRALQGFGLVTGNVAAADGAQVLAGTVGVAGTLTIGGNLVVGSGYTNTFDLAGNTAVGGGTNDLLRVTGDFDPALSIVRINPLQPLVSGTYRLIEYAGMEVVPLTPTVLGNNSRDTMTLDDAGTGVVDVIVVAGTPQDLRWNAGFDSSWDLGTSNWVDVATGIVTDRYYDLDTVLFNETGATANVVNVVGLLRPAAITVSGASNYTFIGTGRIQDRVGGPTALVKDGAGTLTMANTNEFTGGIVVSNGTLALGAAGAFGPGTVTMLGGTLAAANGNQTLANPVSVPGSLVGISGGGATLTVNGVVSGVGALVKTGVDEVVLNAANTMTGGVILSQGTLVPRNNTGMGAVAAIGDASSDTNELNLLAENNIDPTNAIFVTTNGSGRVTIGSRAGAGGNDTGFTGPLILQGRDVVLRSSTPDRTTFYNLQGTGNVYVLSTAGRVTMASSASATTWVGNVTVATNSSLQQTVLGAIPTNSDVTLEFGSVWRLSAADAIINRLSGVGTGTMFAGQGSRTLSVGAAHGSATFSGTLRDEGTDKLTFVKLGTGTQTLDGVAIYTGDTTIRDGRLALGASTSITGSPSIILSNGAVFDVTAPGQHVIRVGQTLRGAGIVAGNVVAAPAGRLVPGTGGTGGTRETLTINGDVGLNATSTNYFNLGATTNEGGGFNDLVVIGGNLEPSGSVIRIDIEEPLATGTYRLMTYGGAKVTAFDPALGFFGLPLGRQGAVLDESVANQVNLVVTGAPANLVWMPQTNANWNYVDANWSNTATAVLDKFLPQDAVTFDESGAYSNAVTLNSTNVAGPVTVTGASNYTFLGTGSILGAASLTKSGAGTLTMLNTNNYSGVTRVNEGVLQIGNTGAVGNLISGGGIVVTGGATLAYAHNYNFIVAPAISGDGTWLLKGPGVSGLGQYDPTNNNSGFAGAIVITNARFQYTTPADIGGATVTVQQTGQFWLNGAGARNTNALIIAGLGWQEPSGQLGAIRLSSAENLGPITLSGNARLSSHNTTSTNRGAIVGDYQVESWHNGYDLFVYSTNTFTNLLLSSGWWVGNHPGAFGPGLITFNGAGLAAFDNAVVLTNPLQAANNIHVGYNRNGTARDTTFTGPWNLGGAGRQFYVYNTNYITGTMTNGGLEVRQDGLMVFNGDIRLTVLHVNQSGANGNVRQDGGTVTVANAGGTDFRIGHWSTAGTYTMNGGLLSNAAGRISVGWDGTGTFTINGGTVYSPWVRMDDAGADNPGRLNLNGGSLVLGAGGLDRDGTGYTVNLNGGTLAMATNGALTVDMAVNGTNGATTLDSAANTMVLHGAMTGTGSVAKVGSGMLALNGAYNAGPIAIDAGTLAGTGTLSVVNVGAAGAVQPGYLAAANRLTVSSLTFVAGAQFNPLLAGTGALLRVAATNGLVVPSGANTVAVHLLNATLATGTFTVIDYEGAIQGGDATNLVLGTIPPRMTAYLTNNVDNTSIDLVVVTAGEPIKWMGNTDGNWNIGAPTNWLTVLGGLPVPYLQSGSVGDALLFDDTAVGNFGITLLADVSPSAFVASNAINDYAIGGGFGIGGPVALRKYGAAKLTLATTNSFVGSTLIAGGILQLGDGIKPGTLGGGPVTNLGTLAFDHAETVSLGNVISGTGGITKDGAGTVTLTAANTYNGGTIVRGGTLLLAGAIGYSAQTYTIASGAVLRIDVPAGTADYNAATYVGTGTLVKTGAGTVRWGAAAANIALGAGSLIDVHAGTLDAGSNANDVWANNRSSLNVSNGATMAEISYLPSVFDALTGGGLINLDAGAGAGPKTFTIGANNTAAGLYNPAGFATFSGTIMQGGALIKVGTGTQLLNGVLGYTGDTTINGGRLALGASTSITGSPTISVSSGAVFDVSAAGLHLLRTGQTLRGGGQVEGGVVASAAARLVPGTGGAGGTRETLAVSGDVGLNATSTNYFNLGSTTNVGAPFNDLVVIGGNLEPSNSVIWIDVDAPPATGVYRLMTYGGTKSSTFNPVLGWSGLSLGRKGFALDESVASQINLAVTGEYANLVWLPQANGNWNFADGNWSNTTSAALDLFFQGDNALFDERGAYSNVVTLTSTTQPTMVTVTGGSNYTFQGAGRIQGAASLLKTGAGTLTVATTNTYTGGTRVENGVLRMGQATAFGSTAVALVVTNTGAFDVNGIDSAYTVDIAGNGFGGLGAIVNNGPAIQTGPDIINLTGDAAIGGANRWDIRGVATRLNLNGFTLTKLGTNYIPLVQGTANSGTVEIVAGGFGVEAAAIFTQGQVNVRSGGNLGLYNNSNFTVPISMFGGRVTVWNASGNVTLQPPLSLSNAPATFQPDGGDNLWITNVISGPVGFVVSGTGGGGVELAGDNTFVGDVVVSNGYLTIGRGTGSGSIGGNVSLFNGSTLYLWRSDALTLSNNVSGIGNVYVRNPSGLTIDGRASIQVSGDLRIPWDVAHSTVLVETGASVTVGNLYLGNQANWRGAVTQHAGVVTATNLMGVGQWTGATSRYFMAGGTLNVTNARLSIGWDAAGFFIQTGGVVNARRAQVDANGSTGGGSAWVLEGGSFNIKDALDAPGDAADLALWGGGTIGALGNWSSSAGFRAILTGTNGNTTIDTADFLVTFTGSVFTGSGGMIKAGAGTLVLAGGGSNQYAGGTAINAGTLQLNNQLLAYASVAADATLAGTGSIVGVVNVSSNGNVRPGAATAGPLSATAAVFQAGARFNPLMLGTAAILRVTGTDGLVAPIGGDVVVVNVSNIALAVGTYTLLDYAGAIQGGSGTNFVLGPLPPHMQATLTNNEANTSIDLLVTVASDTLKWTGSLDANWNIDTTTNWATLLGGLPAVYLEVGAIGDAVLFDDSAAGNFDVLVAQSVMPSGWTVSNETQNYSIGGQPITGAVALVKRGAARLTLLSSNQFTGAATLHAGELRLGDPAALGPAGNTLNLNGGSLTPASDTPVHAKNVLLGGSATAVLDRATSGAGIVNTMGTLTFTGGNYTLGVAAGTNVTGGTAGLAFGGIWSGNTRTLTTEVGAGTELTLAAGMPAGAQNVTLVKNGSGSLVLSGDNGTWDNGTVSLNGGTLDLRHVNAMNNAPQRPLTAAGGTTLRLIQDVSTAFAVPTTVNGSMSMIADRLTPGAGTTHTMGTLNINGTSQVGIGAGASVTSGVQAIVFGAVTVAGDAAIAVADPGAAADLVVTIPSTAGAGSLTKDGSGLLVLLGTAAHAGATTISNGTLLVQGSINNGVTVDTAGTLSGTGLVKGAVLQHGTIDPGAGIGTLTVSNQLNCTGTAVTRFELGGTNAPTDYDRLIVSDIHTPAGTLEVVTTNGYVPASGDSFLIISNSAPGGSLFGTFTTANLPALATGLGWVVQYNGLVSVGLLVTGTVASATPYDLWAQSITNPALRGEQEDADGDGSPNLLEYSQGSDATNAADSAKLTLVRSNGQFLAVFNRVNTATDIVYEVEGAYAPTNGASWLGIATNAIGSWGSSTNVNDNNTAAVHQVWVTDLELGTNRTLRLKITRP